MANTILTNEELNLLCSYLLEQSHHYSINLYPFIHCQYNTGLRVNEVFELERWVYLDSENLQVALEKTTATRIIQANNIPLEYLELLGEHPQDTPTVRVRQYQYFIKKFLGVKDIRVGDKSISSHLFRYNFIRQLSALGWSIQQIRQEITHSSASMTASYLTAPIVVSGSLSPSLWQT